MVDCGTDAACFVVMAERCEPAVLEHDSQMTSLMLTQHVRALFRIAGKRGESCALYRLALERDMILAGSTREALQKEGRTQNQIEALRAEALLRLYKNVPEKVTCAFPEPRVLELALGIYEEKYIDGYFREPCHEPAEGEAWPDDLVAPAPREAAAAQEAASTDEPAAPAAAQ